MKFISSIKNILIILLVLIVLGGIYTYVINKKRIIKDYETILSDTTKYFVHLRILDGKTISEQNQKITGLEVAVATGDIKIKDLEDRNFKSVQTVIQLRTINTILNDSIKYLSKPEIIIVKDSSGVPSDYMKIPQKFAKEDRWYSIFGDVNRDGIMVDSMWMFSEPSLYIGKQWNAESGIFKKLKGTSPVITYEDANPYVRVVSMKNNVIIEPDKWYETGWFKFLCGAIAGTGTTYMMTK